jgi:oxygen-independent coproporphyrinogen-3 oxidase
MHLYLHVPFCARRCSYCDFAIAVRRQVPDGAYLEAVLAEWKQWQSHEIWREGTPVRTVYFGGGTPSLLSPETLARVLDQIRRDRSMAADAEITIEANPDDVSAPRVRAWRAAGINRVSLGVQSFDPAVLSWMHRSHTAEQSVLAVELLRGEGVDNLSLDLIFALPAHLDRDWRADLDRALQLAPDHLSLYGLTVEDRTPVAHWMSRGESAPADEGRYAEEFLLADRWLGGAGFEHYEVSNYARPGRRARHNSAYWQRAPYIGLGPSAHSGIGDQRRWNLREWAAYQRATAAGASPVDGEEQLTPASRRLEDLYLGLRTSEGLPEAAIPAGPASLWAELGWLQPVAGGTRRALTPEGWLRMDAIVTALAGQEPAPRAR